MKQLLNHAMSLLALRPHSEQELRYKLSTRFCSVLPPSECSDYLSFDTKLEHVIAYCLEYKWLDDANFAQCYMRSRSQKGYGMQRIKVELLQKGVGRELIVDAENASEIEWEILARKVVFNRFGKLVRCDWKEKAKVKNFLYYRGFRQHEIQFIFHNGDE